MDTDACNSQVGFVLLQNQEDGKAQAIKYVSRAMSKPKKNLETTNCEYLAVSWAVLLLRTYLKGTNFIIRTDHHSLKWMLNPADVTGMLKVKRLQLTELDFKVIYRASVRDQDTDALSGLHTTGKGDKDIDGEAPVLAVQYLTGNMKLRATCNFQDFDHTLSFFQSKFILIVKADDIALTIISELILVQSKEAFWEQFRQLVGTPHFRFTFENNGLLMA